MKARIHKIQEKKSDVDILITSPSDVAKMMYEITNGEPDEYKYQERVWAVLLSHKNHVKKILIIASGGIEECKIDQKFLFRSVLINCCRAIIVVHNHPSGDITPSRYDKRLTDTLACASRVLGIKFLDSIIIGKSPEFYSFSEKNLINDRLTPGEFY